MQSLRLFKTKFFWKIWFTYSLIFLITTTFSGFFLISDINIRRHFLLWNGLISTAVVMLVGFFLVRRAIIPLQEIITVSSAMREQNYSLKVQTLPQDEIGEVGATINKLCEQLVENDQTVERLEGMRRNFVANVSHEIKTPLTSIMGYTETLMDGAVEDQQHRYRFLNKILSNSNRLMDLVQDILSLSKIESMADTFKVFPTDWVPVIRQVLATHEDKIVEKQITVKQDFYLKKAVVEGEHEAMYQIFENLLTNAIRYTPKHGRILIRLSLLDDHCVLEVEDSGVGIEKKHIGRLFERFYRVDKARSRELGGTGLGLAIVKHYVLAMQGEILVHSETGEGTLFKVILKLS